MQSTTLVHGVPFKKKPRAGQIKCFNMLAETKQLNAQLPTGYGKTIVNVGSYSILKRAGRVNRLLTIFPSLSQLQQFKKDGPKDLESVGVSGPLDVIDVSYFKTETLNRHKKNASQVYAITVQALIGQAGGNLVREMMQTGMWMVTVDEHHHYGLDKKWGLAAQELNACFRLALSATPNRPDDDGIFGKPEVVVTYRKAVEEKAVKPLRSHSYVYRLDAIGDGEIRSYTTDELAAEVGSNNPEEIEKFRIKRKMRWSPKYVSPLVVTPLQRLISDRMRESRGIRNQALVAAMCCSHAEMVCNQIRDMFPELSVDWCGTGPSGRTDEDNARIIQQFCPPKEDDGRRKPTLDVVVNVGMLNEGLDSTNVTEIVFLSNASINNTSAQFIGRGARLLADVNGNMCPITCRVNFDSSSQYAKEGYIGTKIMDAMDNVPPSEEEEQEDESGNGEERDIKPLPADPEVVIMNLELESIRSGDEEVQLYMKFITENGYAGYTKEDMLNPDSDFHEVALAGYKNLRRKEAEKHNSESRVVQMNENVNLALSTVTGRAVKLLSSNGTRFDKTLIGDIKRRINSRKKSEIGEMSKDEGTCRKHYQWLQSLDTRLLEKKVPEWLR